MARMVRCPDFGHNYDADLHSSCPYCGVKDLNVKKTRAKDMPPEKEKSGGTGDEKTQGRHSPTNKNVEGRTVAAWMFADKKEREIKPVVGWLVCINGPEQGRDYRIKPEGNTIGRSTAKDIYIAGDNAISTDTHATLIFDYKKNDFYVRPGEKGYNIYLNDEIVLGPQKLNPYDRVEMGKSIFIFVPLCGDRFQWEIKSTLE